MVPHRALEDGGGDGEADSRAAQDVWLSDPDMQAHGAGGSEAVAGVGSVACPCHRRLRETAAKRPRGAFLRDMVHRHTR